MAVQHVIGVEDEEAVERLGIILLDVFDQALQRVALAHFFFVEAGVDHGPGLAGDFGGGVGAVVSHDKDGDETLVIGLALDAVDQVWYDLLLVPGADEDGEAVEDLWFMRLLLLGERDSQKKQLVGIASGKNHGYDKIDDQDGIHFNLLTPFSFCHSTPRGAAADGRGTFIPRAVRRSIEILTTLDHLLENFHRLSRQISRNILQIFGQDEKRFAWLPANRFLYCTTFAQKVNEFSLNFQARERKYYQFSGAMTFSSHSGGNFRISFEKGT